MRNFIREKKIYCGKNFLEVDIIPRSEGKERSPGNRSKKEKVSAPKQKNLNDKNAKRYFIQLANSNFGTGDLHVSATYTKDTLPATIEEAEREAANYIRRISYRMKKEGLPPLKYILVTEFKFKKQDNEKPIRIHHHLIINGGLDRDTIEALWSHRRKKGEKQGAKIGFVNADRLQPDEYGLEALCRYLTKDPQGKKRWSSSQNLVKPWCRTNDRKYSRRQVQLVVKSPEDRQFWENQYPGYTLTKCYPVYNDFNGWSIYLKMRRE